MRLIQSEIDANPASSPTMTPNVDGKILQNAGVAVLDLVNSSESENNFWIWVRAERPEDAWLEKHCRIEALGAVHGVQDNLENGKYKAYVRQRDSRRLSIKVDPPQQPESRAGVYDMVATVQSQVPLRVGNEDQSLFEYRFKIVVRPYPTWSLSVEPSETPVRIFRRKAIVWATVENLGNDWLYVDLRLPKDSGQLTFERDTERIAVPPAASLKSPSTRKIPIRVRSKYRNIRGTAIKVPVPLTANRIDAPSVPRFPSTADIVVPSLNLSSPVTIEPTTDTKTPSNAEVAYYPPIPATFTDFITQVRTNLMALLTLFLMATAAFYAFTYIYENMVHKYEYNLTKVSPETIPQGGTVVITGPKLGGSDVEVKMGDKLIKSSSTVESGDIKVTIMKDASIPPGAEVVINIRRRGLGFLSWPPIFPALPVTVKIGAAAVKMETLELQAPAKLAIGENITVEHAGTAGFGAKPGTIKLNVTPLKVVSWTEDRIVATIPDDPTVAAEGASIFVKRADGSGEGQRSLTVTDPDAVAPGTTAGTEPPPVDEGATAGATPGGGSAGGSGGGTTGANPDGTFNGGGSAGGGGTEDGTAFKPTPAYEGMVAAMGQGDKNVLMTQAEQAESDGDPNWRALKAYAGAVLGKASIYDGARKALVKNPPPDSDPAGNALMMMAEAECLAAEGKAKQADRQYKALSIHLKQNKLDLALPKAAVERHASGW